MILNYDKIVTTSIKKEVSNETYYKAINWNEIEDAIDKSTWEN